MFHAQDQDGGTGSSDLVRNTTTEDLQKENERLRQELADSTRIQNQTIQELLDILKEYDQHNVLVLKKNAEMQELMKDLHEVAFQDPLTKLLNRRGFERALHRQVGLIQRYTLTNDLPFFAPFLMAIDLDHFKQVNDIKGHAMGDFILLIFGELLQKIFHRDSDIVARFGGDEFLVLCANASREQIIERANELRRIMKIDTRLSLENCLPVTVSIGIAASGIEQNSTPDEMDRLYRESLESADRALYISKESGKDAVSIFSENKIV